MPRIVLNSFSLNPLSLRDIPLNNGDKSGDMKSVLKRNHATPHCIAWFHNRFYPNGIGGIICSVSTAGAAGRLAKGTMVTGQVALFSTA